MIHNIYLKELPRAQSEEQTNLISEVHGGRNLTACSDRSSSAAAS